MNPLRPRIFLIFLLFPAFLVAQNKKLGKAPFFKTFRAKKLAMALTEGLPNDSLKARSIYLWTTRHIKYDVKALSKGKPSYILPRKVLLHRKAWCFGYSILYDSLCKYAGVNSQVVLGYAYTNWYEARDTFFNDNHAWNVQQVNGNWQLVDATWASGYIKPRLQLTRRILYTLFRIPYRQRYRFVRKRNDFYCNTKPELFIYNHLPSTPAWQLLPCSAPIDSFQYSPTSVMHFLRDSTKACARGNDSIADILAEPGMRQPLEMGKQATAFNPRNHQDYSWGYRVYANALLKEANDKTLSKQTRIQLYDSTAKQFDSAAVYFIKTSADFKGEEHFLLARNKRMRQQAYEENRPLIKVQQSYVKQVGRERHFAKAAVKKLRRENKKLRKASRKFQKARFRIKRPEKAAANEVQVTRALLDRIDSNNVAIAAAADSIKKLRIARSTGAFILYDSCIAGKKKVLKHQLDRQAGAIGLRKVLFNSYDTVMIDTKKYIFTCERQVDSLHRLVPPVKQWPANVNNRGYAAYVKYIDRLLADNAKSCRKLGRMSETSFSEDSAFQAQREQYRAWSDSLVRENTQLMHAYKAYAQSLKKLKRMHRRSAKRYRKELHKEDERFIITNGSFRRYFGGWAITMKRNASACKKMKSYIRRKSKKLQQEEKKAQQKSASVAT